AAPAACRACRPASCPRPAPAARSRWSSRGNYSVARRRTSTAILAARRNALLGVAHHAPGPAVCGVFLPGLLLPALPILPDSLGFHRPAQLRRPTGLRLPPPLPRRAAPLERARRAGRRTDDAGRNFARHRPHILPA